MNIFHTSGLLGKTNITGNNAMKYKEMCFFDMEWHFFSFVDLCDKWYFLSLWNISYVFEVKKYYFKIYIISKLIYSYIKSRYLHIEYIYRLGNYIFYKININMYIIISSNIYIT